MFKVYNFTEFHIEGTEIRSVFFFKAGELNNKKTCNCRICKASNQFHADILHLRSVSLIFHPTAEFDIVPAVNGKTDTRIFFNIFSRIIV